MPQEKNLQKTKKQKNEADWLLILKTYNGSQFTSINEQRTVSFDFERAGRFLTPSGHRWSCKQKQDAWTVGNNNLCQIIINFKKVKIILTTAICLFMTP